MVSDCEKDVLIALITIEPTTCVWSNGSRDLSQKHQVYKKRRKVLSIAPCGFYIVTETSLMFGFLGPFVKVFELKNWRCWPVCDNFDEAFTSHRPSLPSMGRVYFGRKPWRGGGPRRYVSRGFFRVNDRFWTKESHLCRGNHDIGKESFVWLWRYS